MSFSLDKNGVFTKPTLKEYNKSRKENIYFVKEDIKRIRENLKYKLERLNKEISEIKTATKNRILERQHDILEYKTPTTEEEFKIISDETETDLRKFKAECDKRQEQSEVKK